MLYEFHQSQNSMSDGKVYATYIVNGTKKPATQPDGDVEMASSAPDPERWGEEVPTQTVTLVTEERLKGGLVHHEQRMSHVANFSSKMS